MKFSIVTPSFNSERFIGETIESVLSQKGDFTVELIIMDGGSMDDTREVVRRYQKLLLDNLYPVQCAGVSLHWQSEKDHGMYDAINKGFAQSTGDVYAWINADDIYLPGAFATIAKVFSTYEDIHWLKGITSYITEATNIWQTGRCFPYTQSWIKSGIYGRDQHFIQQDSVFWRAWLWKRAGGININFKRAGDYYLWTRFAEFTPLVSVKAWMSCFRSVEGQLSQDFESYMKEVRYISKGTEMLGKKVCNYYRYEKSLPTLVRPFVFRLMFGQPEFAAVLISSKGALTRISGEYYQIVGKL